MNQELFVEKIIIDPLILLNDFSELGFKLYDNRLGQSHYESGFNRVNFENHRITSVFDYNNDLIIAMFEKIFPEKGKYTVKNFFSILNFYQVVFSKDCYYDEECHIVFLKNYFSFKSPLFSFRFVDGVFEEIKLTNELFFKYRNIEKITIDALYELIFKNFKAAFYQYFKDDNIIIDNNIVHKIINGTTWEHYEKRFSDKSFNIMDDYTFNERLRNYDYPIKINHTSVTVEYIPLKTLLVGAFDEDFKDGECINQLGFYKDFDYFIDEYYFSDISFNSNDHFFVKYILKDVLDEIELSYLTSVFSLLQFYDELFLNNCATRDFKRRSNAKYPDDLQYLVGKKISMHRRSYSEIDRSPRENDFAYLFILSSFALYLGDKNLELSLPGNEKIITDSFIDMYDKLLKIVTKKIKEALNVDSDVVNVNDLRLLEIMLY